MHISTPIIAATVTVVVLASTYYVWTTWSNKGNTSPPSSQTEASDQPTSNGHSLTNGVIASKHDGDSDDEPKSKESQGFIALYKRMHDEFATSGLNPQAIVPLASWFHGLDPGSDDTPWPRKYSELPEPLPPLGAVRLLVVPLDASPAVLRIAAAVTADVMRLLPPHAKVFANARTMYHCTVFHTSQPTDPRPAPARPDGGLTDPAPPPARRRLPTDEEWAAEMAAVTELVAATPAPVLRLERVVQAASGVLLLTWTEDAGLVAGLRSRLRAAFPGAPPKQATILHSSLLRIVSPEPLGAEAAAAIAAACERWTARLRGTRYSPQALWLIRETEFSTLVGERHVLRLAAAK